MTHPTFFQDYWISQKMIGLCAFVQQRDTLSSCRLATAFLPEYNFIKCVQIWTAGKPLCLAKWTPVSLLFQKSHCLVDVESTPLILHSVNLILSTVLVHLILGISPHHSHHLRSHDLSPLGLLLQTYDPCVPQILSSVVFMDLDCIHEIWTRAGLRPTGHCRLFVLVSSLMLFVFLVTCATLADHTVSFFSPR